MLLAVKRVSVKGISKVRNYASICMRELKSQSPILVSHGGSDWESTISKQNGQKVYKRTTVVARSNVTN